MQDLGGIWTLTDAQGELALAWLDLSTGEFAVQTITAAQAGAASVQACEIDAFAIEAIGLNAVANGVEVQMQRSAVVQVLPKGTMK